MSITKIQTKIKLYEGNSVKLACNDKYYYVEECQGTIYELSDLPMDYNYYEVYLRLDEVEILCVKEV